jgi:hypothetical protein
MVSGGDGNSLGYGASARRDVWAAAAGAGRVVQSLTSASHTRLDSRANGWEAGLNPQLELKTFTPDERCGLLIVMIQVFADRAPARL